MSKKFEFVTALIMEGPTELTVKSIVDGRVLSDEETAQLLLRVIHEFHKKQSRDALASLEAK
jgi:hypothetical protein